MNREDLLEAIGAADETMLEASEKRTKRNWLLSVTAAAVCVALIVGIFWVYEPRAVRTVVGDVFLLSNQLNYGIPDYAYVSDTSIGCADPKYLDPVTQFGVSMSVQVKIAEILPDTYCTYGSVMSNHKIAYRILRLKVVDTIVGSKMPAEIFYLLPAYLSMDIMEYDSFIITVLQVGIQETMMVNVTQNKTEKFSVMFKPWTKDAGWGSMLPFTDGVLDTSLWEKEGWNKAKDDVMEWIAEDGPESYPGKINITIKETKKAIKASRDTISLNARKLSTVLTMDNFQWKEARQALQLMKSQEEWSSWRETLKIESLGYAFEETYEVDLTYTRIINGFATNESITMKTYMGKPWKAVWKYRQVFQDVYHHPIHFTKEDLQNLPDLEGFFHNMEGTVPSFEEGETLVGLTSVYGEYYKYKEYVFGYAEYWWEYEVDGHERTKIVYYIVFPDNTYQETSTTGSLKTDNILNEWIARQ